MSNLGVVDYLVFLGLLILSALFGLYYALTERKKTELHFLLGGRQMTAYPVSLSLAASFMSAITVLGTPAEVYRFGAKFVLFNISYLATVFITGEIYMPVFYRLGIKSTYEYLELRFNKAARSMGSFLFIVQTMLYTGIVIYAPALALNQVTGFELWSAIVGTGIVCTFYCTVGGFKAVVWTDVFQAIVMLAGFGSIIIQTSKIQGGLSVILRHAEEGGRLNLWDFNISPLQRHTFWTILIGGTFTWTSIYGINQSQVQRYVSCKSKFHAKLSLYLNLVGLFFINIAAVFCGLSLYSVYHNCDPWTSKKVWSPDQLMPYLAIDILQRFPGLSGLFVAAAYSGTLSTVSSSITALACVTLEDVIKPHLDSPSERTLFLFSKGTCLFYGIICIGMAALASLMGSMLQAALSIFGMIGGPLLGLFTLGILFPLANSNGAFIGILCGFITSLWIGVGAYYYPPPPKRTLPLPLSVANCSETRSMYLDWTNFTIHGFSTSWDEFYLSRNAISRNIYSLSYLYLSTVGTLVTIIVGLIASLLTGGRHQTVDKKFFLSKDDTSFGGLKKVNQVEVSESLHSMKTLEGSEKPGEDQDIDQKLFLIKDDSSFGSFKKINQVEVSE